LRPPRLVIICVALVACAVFAPIAPAPNYGGDGGGTICFDEQRTLYLANNHWVIESPVGYFNQATVRLYDYTGFGDVRWSLERWVVQPPNNMFRAWTSPTFWVNQPGYAYWPGWYGSPQTSEIYEQFRLIVDGTGHFSYGLRPWSQSGRCW
jgi:hypothetical protein